MKHYYKKKAQDPKLHWQPVALTKNAFESSAVVNVVAICVKNAIKNMLKPFKKESSRKRLMAKQTARNNARYADGGVFRTRTCMAARCLADQTQWRNQKPDNI